MRHGDGGYEQAELDSRDGRAGGEPRRAPRVWTRFLACIMACFDAFGCCATAAPSPPRMRRVTTQTSVERLLPQGSDAVPRHEVMLAPPAQMRSPLALGLPLEPRSPEPHAQPRTCAEFEGHDASPKKKHASLEQPEECPLCLEARRRWRDCADTAL